MTQNTTISTNWYNQGLFAAGLVHGLNMTSTTGIVVTSTPTRRRTSSGRARGPAVGQAIAVPVPGKRRRRARRRQPAAQQLT